MATLNDYWRSMRKQETQRRVFIRARKNGEKLHYIGYVSKNNHWHKTLINSWLFRFGGYKEIRYYNPTTKKLVGVWDLEKHDKYCREHGYNDMVTRDGNYVTLVDRQYKKNVKKEEVKEKEIKQKKSETLREYFDRIHIDSGDDSGFIIVNESTEMQVSRRYLECSAWEHLLDYEIYDYIYPVYNMYGVETIKLYIRKKEA